MTTAILVLLAVNVLLTIVVGAMVLTLTKTLATVTKLLAEAMGKLDEELRSLL